MGHGMCLCVPACAISMTTLGYICLDVSALASLENVPLAISIICYSDVPSPVICCPESTHFFTCSTSDLPI